MGIGPNPVSRIEAALGKQQLAIQFYLIAVYVLFDRHQLPPNTWDTQGHLSESLGELPPPGHSYCSKWNKHRLSWPSLSKINSSSIQQSIKAKLSTKLEEPSLYFYWIVRSHDVVLHRKTAQLIEYEGTSKVHGKWIVCLFWCKKNFLNSMYSFFIIGIFHKLSKASHVHYLV